MKRILFVLSILFLAGSFVAAEQARVSAGVSQNRANMVRKYLEKKIERDATVNYNLLEAVKKGDMKSIENVRDLNQLFAKDKFGNNCFHLAPNAATLQALATSVRRLAPEQINPVLAKLRNERNNSGETPLMAHINAGRTETFRLLYQNSELESLIKEVQRVDKGGALSETAQIKRNEAIIASQDNSGRTVAQAAQAMVNSRIGGEGMEKIVLFFKRHAPYLL